MLGYYNKDENGVCKRLGLKAPSPPPIQVLGYYSGDENAYDMRKAMPRDVRGASVVPLKRPIRPEELEFD